MAAIPPLPPPGTAYRSNLGLLKTLLAASACFFGLGPAGSALETHPQNPRYFLFRGKPVVLMGSSEHYGAQVNLDFDYVRYLEEVRVCGLNLVRVFSGAYIEVPGEFNISDNTLAPAPRRAIFPWLRTDIPGAGDGGGKFDLTRWDPVYFHRLRDLVGQAGKRGIVVEFTLFSAIYSGTTQLGPETLWNVSPMNGANNINGVGLQGRRNAYLPAGDLLPYQKALARKVAEELKGFDNVILETINEPYWHDIREDPGSRENAPPYLPSSAFYRDRTMAWEDLIIAELAAARAEFGSEHLIARNLANHEFSTSSVHPQVGIINFHYAKPAAASANQSCNRVIGNDENGMMGVADFPYRSEAWEFMLSGGGLVNHLDYSFTAAREDGIDTQVEPAAGGGGPGIRHQLEILRWFLERMPLAGLTPQPDLVVSGIPAGGSVRAIGKPGSAYGIYIRGGNRTDLTLNLPAGTYRGEWIDTCSGLVVQALDRLNHPGGNVAISSPAYTEDIALSLWVGDSPPPSAVLTAPVYNRIFSPESGPLMLTASADDPLGRMLGVEFLDGECSLGVDLEPPYEREAKCSGKGHHVYRARAITTDGRTGVSPAVKVAVRPSFRGGVNLNGEVLTVDGHALQSNMEAEVSGMVVKNAAPATATAQGPIYPAGDHATELLLRKYLLRQNASANPPLSVAYPLANGYYDLFILFYEDQAGFSRDMKLEIEGKPAAKGIGNLPLGNWRKYGPYRTQVTDGMLNFELTRDTKGEPKISAFTVYEVAGPPAPPDVNLSIEVLDGMAVLAYPSGTPPARIQSTADLRQPGGWRDYPGQSADFTDRFELLVPTNDAARFFRLRIEPN